MAEVPLVREIPFRDPVTAFAPLAGRSMAALLDSARTGPQGRFSFIAADPFRIIRCTPEPWRVSIDGTPVPDTPFDVLAAALAKFHEPMPGLPAPFGGGAVGFFGYELGGTLERLPTPKKPHFPLDMAIGLYDVIAAFDAALGKAWIISTGRPETSVSRRAARAAERADWLQSALGTAPLADIAPTPGGSWAPDMTRTAYESKVRAVLDYIRAGDIFQANLTQRWTASAPKNTEPFDLYRRLRAAAAAPFGAFLNCGEGLSLLSASPERFLSLDANGQVETRPIKGTRPRGATEIEDRALAKELLNSAKDRAENLMIVDLLRNDLSRVCVPGSVNVPVLCGLETFPAVHHLVSVVTGRLRQGLSAVDLLRAAFPGGSVTGAPKIRAMEVIHELEPVARGPYCGAIAWIGFDGAMDSSIVIRTLISDGRTLAAHAGGGIVAESDPAREYEESVTKAKPLLRTLTGEAP